MNRADCLKAELVERLEFSSNHLMLRFRPEGGFSFRAGQYATVALDDGGKLIPRAYSIVSSPHESLLEFYIELVPEGALTPRLWALRPGDRAYIRNRAAGRMGLVNKDGVKNHLILATVTGVAPFISMARTYAAEKDNRGSVRHQFAIIHGASRSADLGCYRDELSDLSKEGWLRYVPTVSRPWDDPAWDEETGRVEDVLRKYVDASGFKPDDTVAYIVGHPQMIENSKAVLKRASFTEENIEEEKFFQSPGSNRVPQPPHPMQATKS